MEKQTDRRTDRRMTTHRAKLSNPGMPIVQVYPWVYVTSVKLSLTTCT